jgi:hypothetical protein
LRAALTEIIDDSSLRERLASAAYEIAARDFSVEPAVEKLIREIEDSIAATGATNDRARVL